MLALFRTTAFFTVQGTVSTHPDDLLLPTFVGINRTSEIGREIAAGAARARTALARLCTRLRMQALEATNRGLGLLMLCTVLRPFLVSEALEIPSGVALLGSR